MFKLLTKGNKVVDCYPRLTKVLNTEYSFFIARFSVLCEHQQSRVNPRIADSALPLTLLIGSPINEREVSLREFKL